MKALSIRQPWAELILQGRKTIELRKWKTTHRGLLAIHGGKQVDLTCCREWGLDPYELPKGAFLGLVEVVEMMEFDSKLWNTLREQHLHSASSPGKWRGWRLQNPRRLKQAIPFRGLPGLFQVPDDITEQMQWAQA